MAIKVVFIGNPLMGDDGIGPYLYKELKEDTRLKDFELMELGVIGLGLVNYIGDNDKLIIVDALCSDGCEGKAVLLSEKDLTADMRLVSQHDFGVEQAAELIRSWKPKLRGISLVGIKIKKAKKFSDRLSPGLMKQIPRLKKEAVRLILKAANE